MRVVCALLSMAVLAGCATHATLFIYSEPPGAHVTELATGKALGFAPIAPSYDTRALRRFRDAQGCYWTGGIEVHWVSGARTAIDPIRLCEDPAGRYNITVTRDAKHPGLQQDQQFAQRVEKIFAQHPDFASAYEAAAALFTELSASQKMIPPLPCTPHPMKGTAQTKCK